MRDINLDLRSPVPRKKKVRQLLPDSDEVERRLMNEAIDEVSSLDPLTNGNGNLDDEELMDIEQEMIRRNLIKRIPDPSQPQSQPEATPPRAKLRMERPEPRVTSPSLPSLSQMDQLEPEVMQSLMPPKAASFESRVERTLSHSKSLLRDAPAVQDHLPGPSNIYLHEAPITAVDTIFTEDFGEADCVQLAQAGMFEKDFPLGKQLFQKLKVTSNLVSGEIGRPQDFQPQALPEHDAVDDPMDQLVPPTVLTSEEAPAVEPEIIPSTGMSRSDIYKRMIEEAQKNEEKNKPQVPKRKPRKQQRAMQRVESEMMEMAKPVVKRKRKPKASGRVRLPLVQLDMNVDNIYENLDMFEPDEEEDAPIDDNQVPPIEENIPVQLAGASGIPRDFTTNLDLGDGPSTLENAALMRRDGSLGQPATNDPNVNSKVSTPVVPSTGTTPRESFDFKRPRLTLNDEPMNIDDAIPPLNLVDPPPAATPMQVFQPPETSTAIVRASGKSIPIARRITTDELELARLEIISTLTSTQNTGQGELPDIPEQANAIDPSGKGKSTNSRPAVEDNAVYLQRYESKGEKMVKFLGVKTKGSLNSRLEKHPEYALEVR